MEAEARYTFVGAAVLALLAALVAAVVWLKDVGSENFKLFAIYFEDQALDGLQVGAGVNLRGIRVGRVVDYALSDEKFNRVRVEVRIDRRVPVRTNTVAVIARNFVTGIASINLVNREPPGEPLTEVPRGDRLPVIGEGQSDLDEITGRVSQVGDLATNTLTNLNQLLGPDNRRDVMDTVRSLRELSTALNQRLAALDLMVDRALERALDQAAVATSAFVQAAGRVGAAGDRAAMLADRSAVVAERAGERLDATLSRADQTLLDARTALGRAASTFEALERQAGSTARRLEDSADHVDEQLSTATAELRLSMEAASRVLDRLRDPRAAVFGPGREQLGPGEGKQ